MGPGSYGGQLVCYTLSNKLSKLYMIINNTDLCEDIELALTVVNGGYCSWAFSSAITDQ